MDRKEKAVELFKEGYNCSQSVVAAYADVIGLDEATALKIASSFGAGMGRMREVCGAVSGMFMVAGMLTGTVDAKDVQGKTNNYEVVQEMAEEFKKTSGGSIICKELLGLVKKEESAVPEKRTEEYYKKRPCVQLVEDAATIIDKILLEQQN
ncbi:MAG: C-GCAxxG-C-C family protein [Lachnospiraceae bacterium]|nr:C_GCAxxG_C_C family protein [Lachnospiraceae bacterium]MEE1341270.1 C-GCAxxG-C-C family protein [Lachnospiraceae bacterium]